MRHPVDVPPPSVQLPMTITIESLQIGRVITEGDPEKRGVLDRQWTTGFYKMPVSSPVELTRLGLLGDAVADKRFHGGPDKAILLYASTNYLHWANTHPDLAMSAGALGENLTVTGVDESSVCLGDQYNVGNCTIEISQPRMPCWKIARRWRKKSLTKEVTQTGHTGWYARVLREGHLQRDQNLELIERPNPQWTVARANDVMFQREVDRMALFELMNLKELADSWKENLA